MKKKVMMTLVAMFAMMAALSFTACSSDDDNNGGGGNKPAPTSVNVQPFVCIAPGMLDYFDVNVDINGQKVVLTKDNVVSTTYKSTDNTQYNVLLYTADTQKISSFPSTIKVTATATWKEGVSRVGAKSDYCLFADFNYPSSKFIPSGSFNMTYGKGVNWEKATDENFAKYTKPNTVTLELTSATTGNLK